MDDIRSLMEMEDDYSLPNRDIETKKPIGTIITDKTSYGIPMELQYQNEELSLRVTFFTFAGDFAVEVGPSALYQKFLQEVVKIVSDAGYSNKGFYTDNYYNVGKIIKKIKISTLKQHTEIDKAMEDYIASKEFEKEKEKIIDIQNKLKDLYQNFTDHNKLLTGGQPFQPKHAEGKWA